EDGWGVVGENDIDLEPDQFGGDLGEALAASLCPANFDRDIATIDPTKFAQPPNESGKQLAAARRRGRAQEPNGRQLAHLLRARRERPRGRRAAEKHDELAAPHALPSRRDRHPTILLNESHVVRGRADHSASILAARITLPHFSVSSAVREVAV